MKKYLLPAIVALIASNASAQNVGINTTGAAPDASAMLDISATNKGLLIPRVALTATNSVTPVTGATTSLLVYNTATAGTAPNNVTPGYYYWNGSAWQRLMTGNGSAWTTTGNAGTVAGTNFLGTTDAQSLDFRTNNTIRLRIANGNQVLANADGTAAAPFWSWVSGTNMGMYRIGANVLGFSTNSTERMRIFADGRVTVNSAAAFATSTFFSQATGNNDAVDGNAAGTGSAVYGQNTGTGIGVEGLSNNAAGQGMLAVNINTSGTGLISSGNNAALSYLIAGSGGSFNGVITGISASSSTGGIGEAVYTTQYGNVVRVNYWSGAQQFKINGVGTVSTIVKDLNNEEVTMYCPESPEVLFTDYGQGQLVNGKAHIELDPIFTKNVTINEKHPLRVFIQLEGDCNGVYVTNKTASGFDVIELQNGTSNVNFQWNVVCNRADEDFGNGRVSKNADARFEKANPKRQEAVVPEQTIKRLSDN